MDSELNVGHLKLLLSRLRSDERGAVSLQLETAQLRRRLASLSQEVRTRRSTAFEISRGIAFYNTGKSSLADQKVGDEAAESSSSSSSPAKPPSSAKDAGPSASSAAAAKKALASLSADEDRAMRQRWYKYVGQNRPIYSRLIEALRRDPNYLVRAATVLSFQDMDTLTSTTTGTLYGSPAQPGEERALLHFIRVSRRLGVRGSRRLLSIPLGVAGSAVFVSTTASFISTPFHFLPSLPSTSIFNKWGSQLSSFEPTPLARSSSAPSPGEPPGAHFPAPVPHTSRPKLRSRNV